MPPGKDPQPSENAPKAAPDSPSSQEVPKRNLPQVTGEAPGESAEEMQDRMLGEFRILRRLGRGGMAEVFLAEQTSLKRNVAIKVLRKERLKDETYIKRFKTEAMAAATLTHPNIIQVITIGEAEGTQFIAQEYVQGMNLREFLVRKGPPEIPLAIHLMKQVCGALAAAHAAGIVHRDIKPENIMITRKGDAKVADFGLAQLTQQGERINLTQVGVTLGTPLYMSPEQVNGSKLDHRSDIYSFGVTCYHMLTGSPPFRGETALSVAVQHLKEVAEPLERLRPDLPPQLCKIVHKMMEKNLERRYQDAQSVLKDLRRAGQDKSDPDGLLTSEPEIALPPPPPRIREAPGYQEKRPGPVLAFLWKLADLSVALQIWLLVVLCLVGGAAAAGAGWLMRTPNPFDKPQGFGRLPVLLCDVAAERPRSLAGGDRLRSPRQETAELRQDAEGHAPAPQGRGLLRRSHVPLQRVRRLWRVRPGTEGVRAGRPGVDLSPARQLSAVPAGARIVQTACGEARKSADARTGGGNLQAQPATASPAGGQRVGNAVRRPPFRGIAPRTAIIRPQQRADDTNGD
jgi:serine/threonine protein kinase